MGYLYRRTQRNRMLGRIYWAKYYVNGHPIRESTGTDRETEARRFLKACALERSLKTPAPARQAGGPR
ncbi:MAG: hypothetical protein ACE5JD_01760 [Candidatus Methylomirabilia bacterium]